MATIAFSRLTSGDAGADAWRHRIWKELAMEIRLLGPQIGVEVTGVAVKTLDDRGFAPIYQA
jgi:hypothetical protein